MIPPEYTGERIANHILGEGASAPPANRSNAYTRSAEERFAAPRSASTLATSADSEQPSVAAMRFSASQKAASSETLVRWPAITSECFLTPAGAVMRYEIFRRGVAVLQPMRVETGALKPRLGLAQLALDLQAAKGDAIGVRFFLADALVAVLARAAEIDHLAHRAKSLGLFAEGVDRDDLVAGVLHRLRRRALSIFAGAGGGAGSTAGSGRTRLGPGRLTGAASISSRSSSMLNLSPNSTDGSENIVTNS